MGREFEITCSTAGSISSEFPTLLQEVPGHPVQQLLGRSLYPRPLLNPSYQLHSLRSRLHPLVRNPGMQILQSLRCNAVMKPMSNSISLISSTCLT